jgi:hypothetical protein
VAERRVVYGFARDHFRGNGAIIDGGSFFGSSVVAEGQGLLDNMHVDIQQCMTAWPGRKAIHAYELGYLPAPKSPTADLDRQFGGTRYRMGDSFVPILEAAIAPYADLVDLTIGDLNEQQWPDCPIELCFIDVCFIDVCKTARLNAHASRQFFPHLIPNGSVLINQDFFFYRLPFIKVTMGYLADYFEWVGRAHSSSIYRCIKPVPADVAAYDPYLARDPKCLEYHAMHPREGLDAMAMFVMELSEAYLRALLDRKDEALDQCRALQGKYADVIAASREGALKYQEKHGGRLRDATLRLERAQRQIANDLVKRIM